MEIYIVSIRVFGSCDSIGDYVWRKAFKCYRDAQFAVEEEIYDRYCDDLEEDIWYDSAPAPVIFEQYYDTRVGVCNEYEIEIAIVKAEV